MECLKVSGKDPVDIDRFTILVRTGRSEFKHFFRRAVGMGSNSHCLSGEAMMSFEISSGDSG
jgi:hypothetical protein